MCPGPPGLLPQGPAPSGKRFEKRRHWAADMATLATKSQKEGRLWGAGAEAGRLGAWGRDRERPGGRGGYGWATGGPSFTLSDVPTPVRQSHCWTEQLFAGKGRKLAIPERRQTSGH